MQIKILTYNVLDGGAGREALILAVLQRARDPRVPLLIRRGGQVLYLMLAQRP